MCLFTSSTKRKHQESSDMESSVSRFSSQEILCKSDSISTKRCRICFMSSNSLSTSGPKTRFSKFLCHRSSGDEEKSYPKNDELLTNVCSCRGSIGSVHKSCLQRWLAISNSTSCDLCHGSFRHLLVQKPKTFSDFIASSSSTLSCKSYFWVDVLSFVLLTPVTTVSLSLCLKGLLFYAKSVAEYISLITLMALLITTYILWLITCTYQHVKSFRDWKRVNFELVVDGRNRDMRGSDIRTNEVPSISASLTSLRRTSQPVGTGHTWSQMLNEDRRQRQRIPGGLIRTSATNDDVTMMRAPITSLPGISSWIRNSSQVEQPQTPYPGRFMSHPSRSRDVSHDSLLEPPPYAHTNAFLEPPPYAYTNAFMLPYYIERF